MDDSSNNKSVAQQRNTLIEMFRIGLPAIGLFSAFAYLLGRLFIESYWTAFGISPSALLHTTQDYVFFSFDVVVMSITATFFIAHYWYASHRDTAIQGERWLLGLPVASLSAINVANVIVFLATAVLPIYLLVTYRMVGLPGVTGLGIGVGVGVATNAIDWFGSRFLSWRGGGTGTADAGFTRFSHALGLIMVIVFLLAYLPLITSRMATARARYDQQRLPQVTITAVQNLPAPLRGANGEPNVSIRMSLVTINDGIAYVLLPDGAFNKESRVERQIYAIPMNSISHIVYFKAH